MPISLRWEELIRCISFSVHLNGYNFIFRVFFSPLFDIFFRLGVFLKPAGSLIVSASPAVIFTTCFFPGIYLAFGVYTYTLYCCGVRTRSSISPSPLCNSFCG